MAKNAPTENLSAKKVPQPKAAEYQAEIDANAWNAEESGLPRLAARLSAELVGTFVFMFVGLGATLFGIIYSTTTALKSPADTTAVMGYLSGLNNASSLTFALVWAVTLLALVVAFGRVSGGHFNPAVTVGVWVAGRFPGRDVALYLLVQVAGAIGATALLFWFVGGFPLLTAGDELYLASAFQAPSAGQAMSSIAIGTGEHSPTGIALNYGLVIEFIAVALFVGAVLAATSVKAPKGQAPFTIGLSLGFLILFAAPFTGGGVNPARATATAIFATDSDGAHWGMGRDLALFWLAMLLAGAFVGLLVRAFGPEEDLETVEVIDK